VVVSGPLTWILITMSTLVSHVIRETAGKEVLKRLGGASLI
jgi:hypothetical protein